jgi:putative phosphonate catabolism associated alcohol dehydrogenase
MALTARYVVFNDETPQLSIVDSILPELQEGELLVKVQYTALCRSDINTFVGKRKEKTPTILGHESVGVIFKIASNETLLDGRGVKLTIGKRITWGIYSSDPTDPLSILGLPQKARFLFKYGHEELTDSSSFHGGLSEFIVLRKNTPIVVLEDNISSEVASLINCSIATVAAAFRLAGPLAKKQVMITGAGMLGMFACAMAAEKRASSISAVDISKKRLDLATHYGANQTLYFEELSAHPIKPDVIIDFSGANEAMKQSILVAATGAKIIWVGATFPQEDLEISAEMIIRKVLTIQGMHNYNQQDLVQAVNFLERTYHQYDFYKFIEKSFQLEDIQAAFDYAIENNPFRVGITFKD